MTMLDYANHPARHATVFRGASPAPAAPPSMCVLRMAAITASPGPPGDNDCGPAAAPRRELRGRYARLPAFQARFRTT